MTNSLSRSKSPPLVLLAGPTAGGKTALAVEVASRIGAEIVSADSMQVYRGCAVGTAQPTPEELRGIPCRLAGCVEPDQTWTAADWLREARRAIADIHGRGRAAVVAGGTGLYFKALTEGLFQAAGAERNPELRRKLEAQWDADGGGDLRRRLSEADPEAAGRIHRNDRLRVVRAMEVFLVTGRPISELQERGRRDFSPPDALRFVLSHERSVLYERIDRRVVEMVKAGFAEEVAALAVRGADETWPAVRALGYPQMLRVARGELSLDDAIAEIQAQSRRYAKRQMVLFRSWPGAVWLDGARGVEKNASAIQISLEFSTGE